MKYLMESLRLNRWLVWTNIFVQIGLPVSLAFTPAVMANAEQTSVVKETKLYRLKDGETPAVISAKIDLSLEALAELNNIREQEKPFSELVAGDEIIIPASAFLFNENREEAWLNESRVASLASQFGSAQANGNSGDVVAQMARNSAVQMASQASEQWLGQFGTARAKLGISDDFSLDGSELDLLIPIYDDGNALVFTQAGIRRLDEQTTLNAGMGIRSFAVDKWMLGGNVFFDNDLTGHNLRAGFGTEAWTDYLKLTANYYHGLTDWHQSRDFSDYDERPADGFDLRAEAYLPRLPQVGGKLIFEQYFGDEVALFGNGDTERQKDPHAVTAGLTYTPFPLLSAGVDHRIGSGGESDTSFNLGVNYQIGVPLDKQLSSDRVAGLRTLAGGRLDLVDRNSQIVLEYKKQEVITASLPPAVEAPAEESVMVKIEVNARYRLEKVVWDAAALVAAGGTLEPVGVDGLKVSLPMYQVAGARSGLDQNSYVLGAIAYDVKGNASQYVTTTVIVGKPLEGAAPVAANVTIDNPTPTVGQTLTGTYNYSDTDGDLEGVSIFKWYRNGSEIAGATAKTYDLVAADEGKVIKFEVTPVSATGTPNAGTAVQSAETSAVSPLAGSAPEAAGVVIDNTTPTVGQTLTGTYNYSDTDGDLEGVSIFKWYRNGSEIAGATAKTYDLVAADEGKVIKFEVTPVSATGTPNAGTAVQSAETSAVSPLAGSAPEAAGVVIDNTTPTVGQTLTGTY
ncbi:inverse autotransporter beta domain-containing protein, partial [Aeromonas veronii]|uniref:inverse autotransporter beta domain-containing protein n=1 Tax=Aeromonas veronii TaxID=654 RepID=UPI00207C4E3C